MSGIAAPKRRPPENGRLPAVADRPSRRSAGWVRGAVGIAGFLVVAETVTRSGLVDNTYFPPASTVFTGLVNLLGTGAFLVEVGWTLWAWLIAMSISVAVAVPLGIAIGLSPLVYRATLIPIEILRPLPAVALIPLAILVWGAGTLSKVLLALLATLWPILFNTVYGAHDVDPVAKDTARSFRIPPHARLLRIVLPSAAPFILTGVRVSASIALIVLVGLELVAGTTNGIGSFILRASMAGDMSTVLAGATVAGVVGVGINGLFAAVERRFFAWHVLRTGGGE